MKNWKPFTGLWGCSSDALCLHVGSRYPNKDELALDIQIDELPKDIFKGHLKLHQESNIEATEMDAGLGIPDALLEDRRQFPGSIAVGYYCL